MKQEIKDRIEQINNDIIPEGYRSTSIGVLPEDWNVKKLKDVAEEITEQAGTNKYETLSISAGIGFVNQAKKFGKELSGKQYGKYTVLKKGDFSYNKGNSKKYPQGCIYMLKDRECAAVPNVFESFRFNSDYSGYYEQLFILGFHNKQLYAKINHGVRDDGLLNLNGKDFYSINIPQPPLKVQKKIAEILSTQDKVIELCDKEIEQLLLLKKAYLQELFPKKGSNAPELRFKGYSKPWKSAKVGELLKERVEYSPKSIEYPLMAFIANKGITTKGERYDRSSLIKDEENKPYKRTEKGDFIYSSNNLESGSIGINTYGKASISPVYSIFFSTDLADSDFISRCLIRKDFINEMIKLRQGVIYGQWKIHESDFLKIDVLVPDVLEQKKLGEFLKSIDQSIVLSQKKIEQEKQKKKALMQLLLTGIVRVKND